MPNELIRDGTKFMDMLPGKGPWRLRAVKLDGLDTVCAVSPEYQPRYYRNGQLIQIGTERING